MMFPLDISKVIQDFDKINLDTIQETTLECRLEEEKVVFDLKRTQNEIRLTDVNKKETFVIRGSE